MKYKLSRDGAGLLRWVKKGCWYHIHARQTTRSENNIYRRLCNGKEK